MAKKSKLNQRIPEVRSSGPETRHPNPRKLKGNPVKGSEIAGKWHKPKLGR